MLDSERRSAQPLERFLNDGAVGYPSHSRPQNRARLGGLPHPHVQPASTQRRCDGLGSSTSRLRNHATAWVFRMKSSPRRLA